MLYLTIEPEEFDTLYSRHVFKPRPNNLWAYDSWKGPWIVLRNAYDPEITTIVLPKHVNPINDKP